MTGWPAVTLSRGEVMWEDGMFRGIAGRGQFVRCGLPEPWRLRRVAKRSWE
ncbi:MAG TPA: hypothetical protein VNF69_15135 [Burkholderiales bacterium]|nr:hypothetical protein [Burkholderiales bacterium]